MVSAGLLSAPNVGGGAQNLSVTSLGAATAQTIGAGNHVLGPADSSLPLDRWARPIVQFPNSSFSSIVGLPLVSATLHYNIVSDFLEPGDTGVSEVRSFTIGETELNLANRDLFAGLSGDGGAHTPIGSASWSEGVVGPPSLLFSPGGLSALSAAINGSDPTVGIAFREFNTVGFSTDELDEIVFGVPPANFRLDVTFVPEPATVSWLAMVGLYGLARRQRGSKRPRSR